MEEAAMSRRGALRAAFAALAGAGLGRRAPAHAAPAPLPLPPGATEVKVDLDTRGIEDWTVVDGQWAVEQMPNAPGGQRAVVQRATRNAFNVIVAPAGPFGDVDVAVKFLPISGREDASGGIVVRFHDGKYYVARANALEDNFRLYYFDRGRRQIASAAVKRPPLGQWHSVRLAVVGDHFQGWLDGVLLLDQRDARFRTGRVGLWTKADSVTAFSDLTIRGVLGGT